MNWDYESRFERHHWWRGRGWLATATSAWIGFLVIMIAIALLGTRSTTTPHACDPAIEIDHGGVCYRIDSGRRP